MEVISLIFCLSCSSVACHVCLLLLPKVNSLPPRKRRAELIGRHCRALPSPCGEAPSLERRRLIWPQVMRALFRFRFTHGTSLSSSANIPRRHLNSFTVSMGAPSTEKVVSGGLLVCRVSCTLLMGMSIHRLQSSLQSQYVDRQSNGKRSSSRSVGVGLLW